MRPFASAWSRSTTSFSGQNYLPYSVALLQTYVQKMSADPGLYEFLPPLYKRVRIADAVESLQGRRHGRLQHLRLERPHLARDRPPPEGAASPASSSSSAARTCRTSPRPSCGPIPRSTSPCTTRASGRSSSCWKAFRTATPGQSLPGVSMVKADGSFVRNPNIDRVRDLDEIPSPFLEGAFDSIMAANPSESWIGLWETNRGCPFRCTFCDWGSATAGQGDQVRRGAPATARSTGSPTRRSSTSSAATPTSASRSATSTSPTTSPSIKKEHRLSGGAVGAEHQERHRARLRDAEDPVRRRPEQGRGAVACRAST